MFYRNQGGIEVSSPVLVIDLIHPPIHLDPFRRSVALSPYELVPLGAVGVATLLAAATDLWKFKVYNFLTLPTLALGLLASTILGGWAGLWSSTLGAGFGFALLVIFYALGGVGAGDVKLLTAVGAWLGPYWTIHVFAASALAAGIYAVILVFVKGGFLGVVAELLSIRQAVFQPRSLGRPDVNLAMEVNRADRRRRLVPFAAMICVGYFFNVAWWHSRLVQVWPPYPTRFDSLAVASSPFSTGSAMLEPKEDR